MIKDKTHQNHWINQQNLKYVEKCHYKNENNK